MQSLSDIRPLYFLPHDPLAEEVLIPEFKVATKVDCRVGFFSSEVLASHAPGLATYIASSASRFRLIIRPSLRPADQAALEHGSRSAESLAENGLEELAVTEDLLAQPTLKCLSYVLRTGRIAIKIAVMKDTLYHPKVWIFEAETHGMAAHGSSNFTYAGMKNNFEQTEDDFRADAIPACDKTTLYKGAADEYACPILPRLDGHGPGPHASGHGPAG